MAHGAFRRFRASLADGRKKWEFPTPGEIEACPAISQPGTIYFGTHGKAFYAVNPDDTQQSVYPLSDAVNASAAIRDDGTMIVGCLDGSLYALRGDGRLATAPWPMAFRNPQHTALSTVAPSILRQPESVTVISGEDCSVGVRIYAAPDAAIQWLKDGAVLAGITNSSITFSNIRPAQRGAYRAYATNVAGVAITQQARIEVKVKLVVTPDAGGSVRVEPPAPVFDPSQAVTLTAVAAPGYVFTGWDGDVTGTANPVVVNLDDNKTVTPLWTVDARVTARELCSENPSWPRMCPGPRLP